MASEEDSDFRICRQFWYTVSGFSRYFFCRTGEREGDGLDFGVCILGV
jgi:hypothetical protein